MMLRKFETHGYQFYGVKQIKRIFADKGNYIVEQGMVHLFIILSRTRFFNKTNLEQHLFNDPRYQTITIYDQAYVLLTYLNQKRELNDKWKTMPFKKKSVKLVKISNRFKG